MKYSYAVIAAALLVSTAQAQAPETPAPETPPPAEAPAAPADAEKTPEQIAAEDAEYAANAKAFYESLTRRTGEISVVDGKVKLTVPETHYFIGPEDSRRVIVDVWGNPPAAAENVQGMLFAKDANPMDDIWGAIVEYQNDGHVTDDDAAKIDYDKLLADMQQGTKDENESRQKAGYGAIELVGWAEPPHYDAQSRKLYWAKTLQFEGSAEQTVNYDIRVLGRDGVLVVSFVSGIKDLAAIREAAPTVLAIPEFTAGSRYADYVEGVDKKAAYGIAGLIAGGAALALVKKAGLLGIILAFGKKFVVLLVAGIAALANVVRGMFGKKKAED